MSEKNEVSAEEGEVVIVPEEAVQLLLESDMFANMGKAQQRLVRKLLGSKDGLARITDALQQSKGNKIDAARAMIGKKLESFLPDNAFEGEIGDLLSSLDAHDQLLDDEASEDDRNDVGSAQMNELQTKAAEMMSAAGLTKGKTIVNSGQKLGRNSQCPCGSGKKYKNCCMRGKQK